MPSVEASELRELAIRAGEGDDAALETVLGAIREDIYRLALRMLWHPDDAADATQEALIRIMTRIGAYRGEAAFSTWAFRVATNHILNWRASRVEREHLDFQRFGEQLNDGLSDPRTPSPEGQLLVEEVKLGCTLGMLQCLKRDERVAYVLVDVFGLSSTDAAFVCDISPEALRQRASRARRGLQDFVSQRCGLIEPSAACHCAKRVDAAMSSGRIQSNRLLFASPSVALAASEMEGLYDLGSLMKHHPDYQAPERVRTAVRSVIESGRYLVLSDEQHHDP